MIGAVVVGCLACSSGIFRIAAPFKPYLEGVIAAQGLSVTVERCDSFGSSRKGRCWLTGEPAELQALLRALDGGQATSPKRAFGQTCLEDAVWGVDGVAHPGTMVHTFGASYPANQQNILPERGYLSPDRTRACIELSFPFG